MSNGLWAALVDEPMAQLHGCAMPIGKFVGSAYRLDARAQGVVRVHVWGQTVTSVDPTEVRKLVLPARRLRLGETPWPLDEVQAGASLRGNHVSIPFTA